MVVVTGATGHIGNALIRELISKGEKIRVLILYNEDNSSLKDFDLEIAYGDVRDIETLNNCFDGAEYVYHLAGIVSIGSGKRKILNDINVQGTKNVINACISSKVKRLVYVSSIHAFPDKPYGECITETKVFDEKKVTGNYAKSKCEATKAVLDAVDNGLDAVIVHPTGVIGPYEFKLSNMGQLVVDFIRGRLYAYIDGTYDFVDVRDVAKGIILACENGRKGENYILSGEQISVKNILVILEKETGVKAPKVKIPIWIAKIIGPFAELYYKILRQQPLFTSYSIKTLLSNSQTTHKKAENELGYSPISIKQSIIDTVKWITMKKDNI